MAPSESVGLLAVSFANAVWVAVAEYEPTAGPEFGAVLLMPVVSPGPAEDDEAEAADVDRETEGAGAGFAAAEAADVVPLAIVPEFPGYDRPRRPRTKRSISKGAPSLVTSGISYQHLGECCVTDICPLHLQDRD